MTGSLFIEYDLRAVYAEPAEAVPEKCFPHIGRHRRRYSEVSSFLCIGSSRFDNLADVLPCSDEPGLTHALDAMFGRYPPTQTADGFAVASVFQPASVGLGRKLVGECRCLLWSSYDERVVIELLSNPSKTSTGKTDLEETSTLRWSLTCAVAALLQICDKAFTVKSSVGRVDGDNLPFATPAAT